MPPLSPRALAQRFLEAIVAGDPDELAALYAPELEIEMPFGPPLFPARIPSGRAQIAQQLTESRAVRRYLRVEDTAIHPGDDGETVLVEYLLHGEHVPGGEPFFLRFAMVMTVRGGVIVHTRDYTDPLAGASVMGRQAELVEHLTSS